MPFLRACEKTGAVPRPLPAPTPGKHQRSARARPASCGVEGLGLAHMPRKRQPKKKQRKAPDGATNDWGATIRSAWAAMAGEAAALKACRAFVAGGMLRYEKDRSRADLPGGERHDGSGRSATSHLSVALRFGELSPRVLYWAIKDANLGKEVTKTFARRLHWRDLAYYHLSCFPRMRTESIRSHYDKVRWCAAPEYQARLAAWQRGRTGYPMVDAGMRELYVEGQKRALVVVVVVVLVLVVALLDY